MIAPVRRIINPPYSTRDFLRILGVVIILVTIPLTVLLAVKGVQFRSQAAGFSALTSTFKSISVYAPYVSGSPTLEYKKTSSSTWLPAYPPYVDGTSEIRGSIVGLTPNTPYDVRLTVGGIVYTGAISTKNDQLSFGTGNTYYVATTGSDSNSGTSAAPFKTIQKAANTVVAGDTVKIKTGTYVEKVTVSKSGTSGNPISFANNGDGEVIISGGSSCASSNLTNNFLIESQNYVRISGLTAKNASEAAIRINGGGNHIIDNNKILDWNCADLEDQLRAGVAAWNGAKNLWVLSNTISRTAKNTLMGDGFWTKNTGDSTGGGHIIAKNTIIGAYDAVGGEPEDTTYGGVHKDADIYENTVTNCNDDGIQPEGGNTNVRVWDKKITSCMLGVGMAPTKKGPLYVFRNVIVDSRPRWTAGQGMFKLGDYTTGRIYVFHNSYYSTNGADGFKQSNTQLGNMVSRNNSVYSSRYAIETTSHNGLPMDFNYDLLYTSATSRFVKWNNNNDYTDLAKFQATGQETRGIQANPKYVNPSGGDLTLQSGAPGIDKGQVLPNFNDANSAWAYTGTAPDMGAFEAGGATPPSDTTPPSVSITSPTNGATVSGTVTLAANASDNVSVAKVEFYLDGSLKSTDTSSPYSYSWDTTTTINGSHTLSAKAYDALVNVGTSSTVSVNVNNQNTQVLTFTPTDDATIVRDFPYKNFGSLSALVADGYPRRNFLVKFLVSGVTGRTVVSAKLRFYCFEPAIVGGIFYRTTNDLWKEGTITWSNAGATTTKVATLGYVAAGKTYDVDVSAFIKGNGVLSLAIATPSADGAAYYSKERGGVYVPKLIITIQ